MNFEMTYADWLDFQVPIDQVIINASPRDGSDDFVEHFIGVGVMCRRQFLEALNRRVEKRNLNNKLYCKCFATHTDQNRRGPHAAHPGSVTREFIDQTLKANGFETTSRGQHYFADLLESKFTFSPEGNGLDCHRHYEALIFKSIPILERNPLIEKKYAGLPVIYTRDYSEIDTGFLEREYAVIMGKTHDFAKLFMDFHNVETQREIKRNGNYWVAAMPEISGFDGTPPWPEEADAGT